MISQIEKIYYQGVTINDNIVHYINKNINMYTNITLTGLIIKNFYQLENELMILEENGDQTAIIFDQITYKTKEELMTDLELKLNAASPNNYIYTVDNNTNLNYDDRIKVHCSNNVTTKKFLFSPLLAKMYGFLNKDVIFTHNISTDNIYNLTPINNILIKSNISLTSSIDNEQYYDILGIYDINNLGKYNKFDLITNSRKYNKITNFRIIFVTDDDIFINRGASYFLEISLFRLENFLYLESYIEYQFNLIKKEAEIEREKQLKELIEEEKILKNKLENIK